MPCILPHAGFCSAASLYTFATLRHSYILLQMRTTRTNEKMRRSPIERGLLEPDEIARRAVRDERRADHEPDALERGTRR